MKYAHRLERRPRILWDVLLAVVFGGVVFAVLSVTTGGLVVAIVMSAVAVIAALGVVHYLLWGEALLKNVAPARYKAEVRARRDLNQATPEEEFNLVLNEHERRELVQALERSLPEPAHAKKIPDKGTLQEVLNRLRGFGA